MTTKTIGQNGSEFLSASQNKQTVSESAAALIVYRAVNCQKEYLSEVFGVELVEAAQACARQVVEVQVGPKDPTTLHADVQESAIEWASCIPRNDAAIEDKYRKLPGMFRFSPMRQIVAQAEEDLASRGAYAEALPAISPDHQAVFDRAVVLQATSEVDQVYGGEALDYAQTIGLLAANTATVARSA